MAKKFWTEKIVVKRRHDGQWLAVCYDENDKAHHAYGDSSVEAHCALLEKLATSRGSTLVASPPMNREEVNV